MSKLSVAANIISELDTAFLSIPVVACGGVGVGFSFLEQCSNPILKSTGWVGSRTMMALTVISGTPLIVYSTVKALFAAALNVATFKKINALNNFQSNSEIRLYIILAGTATIPLALLAAPSVISIAFKSYAQYKKFNAMYQSIQESKEYKAAMELYETLIKTLTAFKQGVDNKNEGNVELPVQS